VSDIAKPSKPGQEMAKGGQTGGTVAPNGQELATVANASLDHMQAPGQELTK
jgi:hypothetical protein